MTRARKELKPKRSTFEFILRWMSSIVLNAVVLNNNSGALSYTVNSLGDVEPGTYVAQFDGNSWLAPEWVSPSIDTRLVQASDGRLMLYEQVLTGHDAVSGEAQHSLYAMAWNPTEGWQERVAIAANIQSLYYQTAIDAADNQYVQFSGGNTSIQATVLSSSFVFPSTEVYALHADHLGSIRRITNDAQATVWQAHYQAFGEVALDTDPDGDGTELEFNFRFPGQYFDAESGLHYNYFRDYDPGTGRYVQSDPIGFGGGINFYGYAYQNPLNFYDPDGAIPVPVAIGIGYAGYRAYRLGRAAYAAYRASKSQSSSLPGRGSCKAAERAYCAVKCGGAHKVNSCYVTIKWKIRGVREDGLIRSEQRRTECDCDDDDDDCPR